MAEQNNNNQLLMAAVLGVMALMLAGVLTFYQFGVLKDARAAAAAEQQAVARVQEQLNNLEQVKEQAEQMEERMRRLETMIPSEPDEDRLIGVLRHQADNTGMELQQVRFKDRVTKDGYQEMPVEITFEGSYHNLLDLLAEMQQGQRAMRIDELKVSKGRQALPAIKADITASAFYAPR